MSARSSVMQATGGAGPTTKPSRSPGARILAKSADVNHVPVWIVARQQEDWAAVGVVELLVVIVLERRDALAARQIEQLEAALRESITVVGYW